jgi:hypothetical protein
LAGDIKASIGCLSLRADNNRMDSGQFRYGAVIFGAAAECGDKLVRRWRCKHIARRTPRQRRIQGLDRAAGSG